ncbi:NAD-dependent dehydratase [Glutamicibacter uratoxydans]|uniref:NAD-dependent dehydratase n=1 Tax=Glutamicibacter uratoxydans TaxID=43667 RepID=A0A4Y4DJ06_GLUUR|nr:NAD-dependent epimerase/dehydratase family protein [Glutamicibacter uratoxydans]GED04607.1 NAD-dependent dehydratase [Glutamicibacter uratoxydans]
MQTILGSGGQIANELARELHRSFTTDIRLASRNPQRINPGDELASANLLDLDQTLAAASGSEVIYFTAGLPADTELWERQFPTMLDNALTAARSAGAKFVYFDNTYMYPQDSRVQDEQTAFAPAGRKGTVRALMAQMVLEEMQRGEIPVLIGRAPEFYGPGRTQSFTNALILDRIAQGKKPFIPVADRYLRSLIWTPDASRALATLANTSTAYGQTWHLPTDPDRLTYRQFASLANEVFDSNSRPMILPRWVLAAGGRISARIAELDELLPRYAADNIFDSTKFTTHFPDFSITKYREGLEIIKAEREITSQHA